MKKIILCFSFVTLLLSCNNGTDKTTTTTTTSTTTTDKVEKSTVTLPYTASYTSNFTSDVSDSDLNTVLTTYKDWENGNMTGLAKSFGDSVDYDANSGLHSKLANAGLMKMWSTFRDSLNSVKIDMEAWHKMYATDKKDAYIVTWYKETDTYKDGRIDSASYHDINQVKNGKIIWYSQYKRPFKK